jgi:hypothetical protein
LPGSERALPGVLLPPLHEDKQDTAKKTIITAHNASPSTAGTTIQQWVVWSPHSRLQYDCLLTRPWFTGVQKYHSCVSTLSITLTTGRNALEAADARVVHDPHVSNSYVQQRVSLLDADEVDIDYLIRTRAF